MEKIPISMSSTAATMTKPLSAYIPMPNSDSASQVLPIHEMPRSNERKYQRLWGWEKVTPKPENSTTEPNLAQTTKSSDDHNEVEYASDQPTWADRWIGFLPNPLSRSTSNKPRPLHQDEYDNIKYDILENFEEGLPRLAAFLNLDDSFGMYRGFLPQASRILVYRMIKLGKLVEKQGQLDAKDIAESKGYKLCTVETTGERDTVRLELDQQIEKEMTEYYDFFEKYRNVRALAKPTKRNHRYVHDWMVENQRLVEGEDDFIYRPDDLVRTMKKGEPGSQQADRMDIFIEKYLAGYPGSFIHRFLTGKDKNTKTGLFLFQEHRLATTRITTSVIVSVSLLLSPVFLLFLVEMPRVAMVCTVFGFVLAFTVVLSLATDGRPQDILIGTAAYGAFLATFLGNLGSMDQCLVPTA